MFGWIYRCFARIAGSGLRASWGTLAAVAIASLCVASSAVADNTYTLANPSPFVLHAVGDTPYSRDSFNANICLGGAWANTNQYPTLADIGRGGRATVKLSWSQSPNNVCLGDVEDKVAYANFHGTVTGYSGTWYFEVGNPFIGPAEVVQCDVDGGTLAQRLAFKINQDNLTCSSTEPTSTPEANFVSTVAAVRGGKAVIPVQLSAKKGTLGFRRPARYQIVLSRLGRVIGRERITLRVGHPHTIKIPVPASVRKLIAKAKNHQVVVQALLKRIDGQKGIGDRITLILEKPNRALRF